MAKQAGSFNSSALRELACQRDHVLTHVLTHEFAHKLSTAPQTVRKNYCLKGECYGIRPIKIGNRLYWPVTEIEALLSGGI